MYKALHKDTEELCVIKEILLCDLQRSGAADKHVKQCLEEAKFLMRNRHPHIIGISDHAWELPEESEHTHACFVG